MIQMKTIMMDIQPNQRVLIFQLLEKMVLERLIVRELFVKNCKKIKDFAKCKLLFRINLIIVINQILRAKLHHMVKPMELVSFKKMEVQ